MKPILEKPRLDAERSSLVAFARSGRVFAWNWHHHPEFELTWIRRGRGKRLVGDHQEDYAEGDLVLLAPGVPHTWASRGGRGSLAQQAVVVQFGSECFPPELLRRPEFLGVTRLLADAARGLAFPPTVARRAGAAMLRLTERDGVAAWSELAAVLDALAKSGEARPLASARHAGRRGRSGERLDRVHALIEDSYRESVPLAAAARRGGLSASALTRLLRRRTGQSYVQARNARRVQEACRLLTETDSPVATVALEAGFENLAHFHQMFRRLMQTTPRSYRQLHEPPEWQKSSS